MAEAAERAEWGRWSVALAMFANAHRKKGQPPARPAMFDPFSPARRGKMPKLTKDILASLIGPPKR